MCIIYNDSIMSDFICDLCEKVFTRKEGLDFHIEHKVCADKTFQCSYCSNKFTSKAGLQRHKREFCRKNKDIVDEKDNTQGGNKNKIDTNALFKQFEQQIVQKIEKKLEKKLEKIKKENARKENRITKETAAIKLLKEEIKKLTMDGGNNNGTINDNNGTVQYAPIEYGKEDITKISREEMSEAYRNGIDAVLKLTQIMHFNPKYPENHNMYISNIKSIYASVFKDNTWELILKEDLIDRIFEDKKNILEELFDDHKNSLSNSRINAYEHWIDLDSNNEIIKKIKEGIILLMYNKRNIPMTTQAKTKKTVLAERERSKIIRNKSSSQSETINVYGY